MANEQHGSRQQAAGEQRGRS